MKGKKTPGWRGEHTIHYEGVGGWKYRLVKPYTIGTGIKISKAVESPGVFLRLSSDGFLTIAEGYAWDGPSGPAIDTPDWMRGSLVHDALYQLMREKLVPLRFRKQADQILRQLLIEDGMSFIRAWYSYVGVRVGGSTFARPIKKSGPLSAP
jgi:hypothetical protein